MNAYAVVRASGRARAVVVALATGVLLAGCASEPATAPAVTSIEGPDGTPEPTVAAPESTVASPESTVASAEPSVAVTPVTPVVVSTEEYLPGIAADLRLPTAMGPAPLIVLVPGGGFLAADRTGLGPLADRLTTSGATTATITYPTFSDGVTFPVPVDDVACAVRWAAARATEEGRPPTHTVVAGHSAGGHLAALVALSGDEFGADCPAPEVAIDGLVGMAGVYDPDKSENVMTPLFGAARVEIQDAWERGNVIAWAARDGVTPEGFRTLLIHGPADMAVPVEESVGLAETLTSRGVDTLLEFATGATHDTVYQADVAAPLIQKWLDSWP